jgi:hypothetical protein
MLHKAVALWKTLVVLLFKLWRFILLAISRSQPVVLGAPNYS